MKIAAIDIGSNSIHMIVARSTGALLFESIDREKHMVKLGAETFRRKRLSKAAFAAGLDTLIMMKKIIDRRHVDEILAVATSAVREAENGAEFLEAVKAATGIVPRIIPGEEEARLIYLAVRTAIELGPRRALALDIGGGSVEMIVGDGRAMLLARSLQLGVLRLRDKLAGQDPMPREARREIEKTVDEVAGPELARCREIGFELAVGTSGTILSLGLATLLRQDHDRYISPHARAIDVADLRELIDELAALDAEGRSRIAGIDTDRVDSVHVGGVALGRMLELAGVERLTLCDAALREGLVQDALERDAARRGLSVDVSAVRRRSVEALLRRCEQDGPHARLITKLALTLFDATAELHGLERPERELLEFAALLHDVGRFISFERHEQHGYYLIRNGGLHGFTDHELQAIALVARFHRKAKPKGAHPEFARLSEPEQGVIAVLAAIVRFVEGLDRTHAQVVRGVDVDVTPRRVRVRVAADGDAEVELWSAARKSGPLSRALDRRVELELVSAAVSAERSA